MPRGGFRPGSGRKRGGKNRKTREIADKAVATGITPLEVMIEAMRAHYDARRLDQAALVARDAAPYVHPRIQHITHKGDLTTTYVAQMPAVAGDADEWASQHTPTLQ